MNLHINPDTVLELSEAEMNAAIDAYENDPVNAYCEFLAMELRLLNIEMGYTKGSGYFVPCNTIARDFHTPAVRGYETAPKPSTRAMTVLAAVGILPAPADKPVPYSINLENRLYDNKMRAAVLVQLLDSVFKNVSALEKLHGVDILRHMQFDQVSYIANQLEDTANDAYLAYQEADKG